MYKTANSYIYSASDLILFMRSPFASWMAKFALEKPELVAEIEKDKDAMMDLLAAKGNQHETDYLALIKKQLGADHVIEINKNEQAAEATIQAMQAGHQVIFQAYLEHDNFKGYADFLIRREGQSRLGAYYYEAWDTKLSKSTKPYFIIQLCCYSWLLESVQGKIPDEAVVVLGDKKADRHRLAAYYSYFLNLKEQFLKAQGNFKSDWADMPDPALYTDYGVWASFAKQKLEESDSLALVANIRKSQIKKLHDAGITTLSQLANQDDTTPIKGIASDSINKIKEQAAIQLASRGKEKPLFKVIDSVNGKGLSALPPHSDLDVYFDIEGHPLMDGGLEYLWGVSFEDTSAVLGKQYAFKDWWAHDQQQEKLAFEGFIDWSYQRWQQDPSMHIYHYASYEITAINKMATRYLTRQDKATELLVNRVFVDLYKIVKAGLLIGEPRYSIKNVEHLYRGKRTTEVANGGDSVVFYENWREKGGTENWANQSNGYESWLADSEHFDWSAWQALKQIRDYNIDDCESTLELATWLRIQQQHNNISFSLGENELKEIVDKTDRQLENEQKRQALIQRQQALVDQFENDPELKKDSQAKLLVSLLHFYDRERKPKTFTYYRRLEKTDEELYEDDTVIHDIILKTEQEVDGKITCTALFNNDQPVRTDKIESALIKDTLARVNAIKFERNEHYSGLSFVINADQQEALQQTPLTLFGEEARINTDKLENRLCEITEQYFKTRKLPKLLDTIVNRANPRFNPGSQSLPITRHLYADNEKYLSAIISAVKAMDETCLCIQGPPGSGKTFTARHIIKALVQQGKRIGIMSNSHAAIMNLEYKLIKELPDSNLCKVGGYGPQKDFKAQFSDLEDYSNFEYRPSMIFTNKRPYGFYQVVGATVYAFANDLAYEEPVDYLFVDEASQVALANLIAVSGAAKNIILMGDQMQLEQPIQGSHPDDSGKSALEYMLQDHAVIPDEKGIFLERTFRMHPDVCRPLSDIVYEGRLQADEANKHQAIIIAKPTLITQQNGILSVPVSHEGNEQCSEEEALVVQQLIDELKTGHFINKDQQSKPITDEDILVVAPYNMQVNLLKQRIKGDIKIGTIDKFQGQEAPVVIISMAVSDLEESPRGLDFIFDINRLNVAVSRAQALAIIVANKDLKQGQVNSLDQMRKIGFFSKLTY